MTVGFDILSILTTLTHEWNLLWNRQRFKPTLGIWQVKIRARDHSVCIVHITLYILPWTLCKEIKSKLGWTTKQIERNMKTVCLEMFEGFEIMKAPSTPGPRIVSMCRNSAGIMAYKAIWMRLLNNSLFTYVVLFNLSSTCRGNISLSYTCTFSTKTLTLEGTLTLLLSVRLSVFERWNNYVEQYNVDAFPHKTTTQLILEASTFYLSKPFKGFLGVLCKGYWGGQSFIAPNIFNIKIIVHNLLDGSHFIVWFYSSVHIIIMLQCRYDSKYFSVVELWSHRRKLDMFAFFSL